VFAVCGIWIKYTKKEIIRKDEFILGVIVFKRYNISGSIRHIWDVW
jgi:hypothetical protein